MSALPCSAELLLIRGGWGCRGWLLASFETVISPRLHFVPLLLLIRIEQGANVVVGCLVSVHHFGATILLRGGGVSMNLLHLLLLRLEDVGHLCFLVSAKVEAFRQHLGATIGVETPTMSALRRSSRRSGLLIAARRILREDRGCNCICQSGKCQCQNPV